MARMTNKELKQWYKRLNRKYFRNALPDDAVLKFADLDGAVGRAGWRHVDRKPTKEEKRKRPNCVRVIATVPRIVIDNRVRFSRTQVIPTLIHEMVHIENWSWNGHGRRFNNRMIQLAKAGAFNGWW